MIDRAFNNNIISVEVKPAYIGRKRQRDVDIIITFFARSYLEARKKIPKGVDFMIYASFKYIMVIEGTIEEEMNHNTTTTYKSSELGDFLSTWEV